LINYNNIALEYARHRKADQRVVENLLSDGRITAVSRVLEVGCGTGNFIIALEAATGCACFAVDSSEEMLKLASRRLEKINFKHAEAEEMPFEQNSFDLVFSVDMIHHLSDHAVYFREARRVLATGAKICTVTESEWMIRNRRPLANFFPETIKPELTKYPRISDLRKVMEKVGFVNISQNSVESLYDLTDIQPFRDRAFSCLHLISEQAFRRGISKMETDLSGGPIPCVSRYSLLWGTK
jgi:ubiquinone/menaquinone biosynthesis C-methylase UbiE